MKPQAHFESTGLCPHSLLEAGLGQQIFVTRCSLGTTCSRARSCENLSQIPLARLCTSGIRYYHTLTITLATLTQQSAMNIRS